MPTDTPRDRETPARPTPGDLRSELHALAMNMRSDSAADRLGKEIASDPCGPTPDEMQVYRIGHRHARHDIAEALLQHEGLASLEVATARAEVLREALADCLHTLMHGEDEPGWHSGSIALARAVLAKPENAVIQGTILALREQLATEREKAEATNAFVGCIRAFWSQYLERSPSDAAAVEAFIRDLDRIARTLAQPAKAPADVAPAPARQAKHPQLSVLWRHDLVEGNSFHMIRSADDPPSMIVADDVYPPVAEHIVSLHNAALFAPTSAAPGTLGEDAAEEGAGWKQEAGRLRELCKKQEQRIEDLTPYIDLFRRLDKRFGCGHTENGAEDAEALLRHVDKLFEKAQPAKAPADVAPAPARQADELATARHLLHLHRRYHGKAGCPGPGACYVCGAEEAAAAAPTSAAPDAVAESRKALVEDVSAQLDNACTVADHLMRIITSAKADYAALSASATPDAPESAGELAETERRWKSAGGLWAACCEDCIRIGMARAATPDAGAGERTGKDESPAEQLVRKNAERDPNYCPYCMRCPGLVRMAKVEPFYWRCRCGAEHDARSATKAGKPAD